MQVNNVTIPDPVTTTEYIADTIGGWMYVVTKTVSVNQQNLQQFQGKLDAAKTQLAEAQALVDELQPAADAFATAIAALPVPVLPAPIEVTPPVSATTTAAIM